MDNDMKEMAWIKPATVFNETDNGLDSVFQIRDIYNPQDDYSKSFYIYADDFRRAAETVAVDMLSEPGIAKLDSWFFCIAFLYRHSIELMLKAIIFQYETDEEKRVNIIKESFHNCEKLLDSAQPFLTVHISDFDLDAYNWLHTYLADFTLFDKESDSFRYPFHIICTHNEFEIREYTIKRVFQQQTFIDLKKFILKLDLACDILQNYHNSFDTTSASLRSRRKTFEDNNECTYKDYKPQFIEEGGSYYMQSVVGYEYQHMDHFPYIMAYCEAGNTLKKKISLCVKNKNYESRNSLFMPMCYCYRNALELSLKKIWYEEISEDEQTKLKKMARRKHKIVGLWNLLLPTIDPFDGGRNKTYNRVEEEYINTINNYDSDASHFRYPCDKMMKGYYRGNEKVNYKSIGDYMEAAVNYLGSVTATLQASQWYQEN